tara:strand:- start:322 stop:1290 length:969 start_codon:yes stop_codon:yes gene_type:complete
MAYFRKRLGKWQCVIRIKGHPTTTKTFVVKKDAEIWAKNIELKYFREEIDILKINYPLFKDCLIRYRDEISIHKRSKEMENKLIKYLLKEPFVNLKLNLINNSILAQYRDRALKCLQPSSVKRRLAIISHLFSIARKEWGFNIDNPVLNIRMPKLAEPRNRRFTDKELTLLINGNKTSEKLKSIIQIALETGMRQSEILRIKKEHLTNHSLFIPVTKTKPRTIPLTKKALELIKNTDLPFGLSGIAVSKQFYNLCKFYNIKDAKFHDLRKQALTNFMKNKNLTVAETMLISGHSDPKILLKIYNNLQLKDVVEKINNIGESR